jgi:hypothetical protein
VSLPAITGYCRKGILAITSYCRNENPAIIFWTRGEEAEIIQENGLGNGIPELLSEPRP